MRTEIVEHDPASPNDEVNRLALAEAKLRHYILGNPTPSDGHHPRRSAGGLAHVCSCGGFLAELVDADPVRWHGHWGGHCYWCAQAHWRCPVMPMPFDAAVMRINVVINLFMKFSDSLWSFGAGALMLAAAGWVVTRIVTQFAWIYVRLNGVSPRKAIGLLIVALAIAAYAAGVWGMGHR